jgi:hypothetical protein
VPPLRTATLESSACHPGLEGASGMSELPTAALGLAGGAVAGSAHATAPSSMVKRVIVP